MIVRTFEQDLIRHLWRHACICAAGPIGADLCQEGGGAGWQRWRELIEIIYYHECSHAVVMLACGMPVLQIVILPKPDGISGIASSTDEAITAQKIHESETDAAQAGRALAEAQKRGHHGNIDQIIKATTRLLRKHRWAVLSLVEVLHKEGGRLVGKEKIQTIAGIGCSRAEMVDPPVSEVACSEI